MVPSALVCCIVADQTPPSPVRHAATRSSRSVASDHEGVERHDLPGLGGLTGTG